MIVNSEPKHDFKTKWLAHMFCDQARPTRLLADPEPRSVFNVVTHLRLDDSLTVQVRFGVYGLRILYMVSGGTAVVAECRLALALEFEKTIETKCLLVSRKIEGLSLWPRRVGSEAGYHTFLRR